MALNSLKLLEAGFSRIEYSEHSKMFAMAALTVMVLNETALAVGTPASDKEIRRVIAAQADVMGIHKPTYEAYVNGIFECSAALARFQPEWVADLGDMDTEDAIVECVGMYDSNNVRFGGHIRAWGKQLVDSFQPYDMDATARLRREKQQADRGKANVSLLAALGARNGRDSSTLTTPTDTGAAPLQIVDYTAEAIRCVDGITTKEALARLLEAVNLRMETFLAAERPATVPPVTSDSTDDTANKARKAPRKPRTVKLAA